MRTTLLLALAVLAGLAASLPAEAARRRGRAEDKLELRRRALRIADADADAIWEVHVREGSPTTLVFPLAIKDGGVLLADPKGRFFSPQVADRSVILVPKRKPRPGEVTSLTVTLADGTILPFELAAAQSEVDLQVDVELALEKKASPESLGGMRAQLGQVRAELDDCRASGASDGARKVAQLVLSQDLDKPLAYQVSRHPVHVLDKQSRLLVEARMAYRLFGYGYLVLTVENRDPAKPWVLDRAQLSTAGDGQLSEVKVIHAAADVDVLPPGEVAKVVVTYVSPEQEKEASVTVELLEKAGNRHVKLEGARL